MTPALLALALGTTLWTDPSGRVRCNVPDEFRPAGEGRFALGDERLILVPFVPSSSVPPAALPAALLTSAGLPAPAPGAAVSTGPTLAGAVATLFAPDGSAAIVLLGLPGDAFLPARAAQVAGACQLAAAVPVVRPPVVANGRVFDGALRLSFAVPVGTEGFEFQGSGAVGGAGFQIFLVAPAATPAPIESRATELVVAQGGAASPAFPINAGLLRAAVSSGSFVSGYRQIFVEAAAIDAGGAVVGAVLVADAASQLVGQQALSLLLASAALGPGLTPPPGSPP
jgi:hypothetical protein